MLIPSHYDCRKMVVKVAKRLSVEKIVIGKHGEEDVATRDASRHLRSFRGYVSGHAKNIHTMIV